MQHDTPMRLQLAVESLAHKHPPALGMAWQTLPRAAPPQGLVLCRALRSSLLLQHKMLLLPSLAAPAAALRVGWQLHLLLQL
jgi:hypothetical protein